MELIYVFKTDVGKKREHNEDSYGFKLEKQFFVVCDGMGGHAAGDYASQQVVETLDELIQKDTDQNLNKIIIEKPKDVLLSGRQLVSLVMLANRRLFKLALMYPKLRGMGTTLAAIRFDGGLVNVVNVGDSRVYRFRDGELSQLSVDHTWMEELLQDGEIKEHDLNTFNKKNVITRAIGTSPNVHVDWKAHRVKTGDIYLLCSDGLSGEINDGMITEIIEKNKNNLNSGISQLISAANDAGGADNITAVLVKVKGDVPEYYEGGKRNELMTFSSNEKHTATIDSYIDRVYPSAQTKVPAGVLREKKKIYQNSLFRAIVAVMVLICGIYIIKQPWNKKTGFKSARTSKGDILVRTRPPGAKVSIYFNGSLLDKKFSPADFLALKEGQYWLEIEKQGYDKKQIKVKAHKGKQEIRMVELNALTKLELTLGISPDFDPAAKIFLNDKPIEYYGTPLTVRRIGLVGKTVPIAANKTHKIKVENAERTIKVGPNEEIVRVKLNKGWIFVENNNSEVEEEQPDKKQPRDTE